MTQTEALRMALEALELEDMACRYEKDPTPQHIAKAITAIREALAEQPAQQQEPVAYRSYGVMKNGLIHWRFATHRSTYHDDRNQEALYKSPPASKPWVGLTEQEHTDIAVECGCMSADWVFYGATVERKLKEKNS